MSERAREGGGERGRGRGREGGVCGGGNIGEREREFVCINPTARASFTVVNEPAGTQAQFYSTLSLVPAHPPPSPPQLISHAPSRV